jgi:hypothetical protein
MAVLIEGISVVVRADALRQKFPGGAEAFAKIVPNQTLCYDDDLFRVGFMSPVDVEWFVEQLEDAGLEFLRDDEAVDLVVVDQFGGPTTKCTWLDVVRVDIFENDVSVAAALLVGSPLTQFAIPHGWKYKGSLSACSVYVPSENVDKFMKFLRHEKGIDIYLNLITGKEMYVGRASE